MLDIALVGAGRIGRIHAANVSMEPRLRLKYVIDQVPAAAEVVAETTGASPVSMEWALDDPAVRGVVVASATDTHLDYCLRAIDAGKAVFCEKPIDLDLDRARAAADVLGGSDVPLLLGFNRRFDPSFSRLQARLVSGELGDLETLHIISHDPAPPPIDYVGVSGGLFRDMAIHDFDMARWLLREELEAVFATAACLVDPAIGAVGDVDTAKTLLRTKSGKLCVISNSRRSGYGYDQRIEAYCARGMICADNVMETTVRTWGRSGPAGGPIQNFFLDRYADAYRAEMKHFVDVIEGSATPIATYDDGVGALALAEAAVLSVRTRKPEKLSFACSAVSSPYPDKKR